MPRNAMRLSRRHEWLVYAILFLVFATGAGWALLHYFLAPPNEFGGASAGESWLLRAHGAAAMLTLILLGTLLPLHVKLAWRAGRNRRTGLTTISLCALLILSGYGLYYFGGERLRAGTSAVHLWLGLAFLPLFLLHLWRGKRTRPRRVQRAGKIGCSGAEVESQP